MKRIQRLWALLTVLAIMATACGAAPSETSTAGISSAGGTQNDIGAVPSAQTPGVVAAPEVVEEPSIVAPTAKDLLSKAVAFEPDSAIRMTASVGQVFKAPYAGIDIESAADGERPTATATRLADGHIHIFADMGPIMTPIAGGDPATEAIFDQISFELWVSPDETVIVDTNGYQGLADFAGAQNLGPFYPGIWSVGTDLTSDASLVSQYLAGTSIPDPAVVADQLPLAIVDPRVSSDGRTISGSASYGEIAPILGSDLAIDARSQAAAVSDITGLEINDLAAAYLDVFETAETWVTITLPEDESAQLIIQMKVDMSHLYDVIFAEGTPVSEAMDPELRDGIRRGFDLVRLEVEQIVTLEPVADATIPDAPNATEDRTAELVEYLGLD